MESRTTEIMVNAEKIIIELIQEVKPSLRTVEIKSSDSIPDRLGLDSLDILQLSRRIRRKFERSFDLDEWLEGFSEHHGSVKSLVDLVIQDPSSE